ncbi:hypothetical protein DFP72DRAFT_855699 [Ephemerocybe angulata]|uniref:KOW domain-containing protein n=1 Tax=Ephemerocybe angulata TaxID=980116 RepID=A0A8H6HFG3_9AGAR|nr:hypothetical protein DFP72DRAFT_855699 [Tulosesus angulatus]
MDEYLSVNPYRQVSAQWRHVNVALWGRRMLIEILGDDGKIIIWDVRGEIQLFSTFTQGFGSISSATWIQGEKTPPDQDHLMFAVGTSGGRVYIFAWDPSVSQFRITDWKDHNNLIDDLAYDLVHKRLATASAGEVRLRRGLQSAAFSSWTKGRRSSFVPERIMGSYQINPWRLKWEKAIPSRIGYACIVSDNHLAVTNLVSGVDVYNLPPRGPVKHQPMPTLQNQVIQVACTSKILAVGSEDGNVTLWDWQEDKKKQLTHSECSWGFSPSDRRKALNPASYSTLTYPRGKACQEAATPYSEFDLEKHNSALTLDFPKTVQKNVFLDVEAQVSEDDEEEDDIHILAQGEGASALVDVDEEEFPEQAARRFDQEDEAEDEAFWAKFLDAVHSRTDSSTHGTIGVPDDCAWSITVQVREEAPSFRKCLHPSKPGNEQKIARRIQRRIEDPRSPPLGFVSCHGHTGIPGRVFIVTNGCLTEEQRQLLRKMASFKSDSITPIDLQEFHDLRERVQKMSVKRPYDWVQIRKGEYKGQIGLVSSVRDEKDPRYDILTVPKSRGPLDPQQTLFQKPHILKGKDASWISQGISHPTLDDIRSFAQLAEVPPQVVAKARANAAAKSLKAGDRVKITAGASAGSLAIVDSIHETSINVRLPSHGTEATLLLSDVRPSFRVGDYVRTVDGEQLGFTGWIIGLHSDEVNVFDNGSLVIHTFLPTQLAFEDLPFVLENVQPVHASAVEQIRYHEEELKNDAALSLEKQLMRSNPLSHWVSKHVLVTGLSEFKGYNGYVRDVNIPDNSAWVELSALSGKHRIPVENLREVQDIMNPTAPLEGDNWREGRRSDSDAPPAGSWEESLEARRTDISHPSIAPPSGSATPSWSLGASTSSEPWNIAITDPSSTPAYWLKDITWPQSKRICLRVVDAAPETTFAGYTDSVVHFIEADENFGVACVRSRHDLKDLQIPFGNLVPHLPDTKGQFVLAFEGEYKGKAYKVMALSNDDCELSPFECKTAVPVKKRVKIPIGSLVVLQ